MSSKSMYKKCSTIKRITAIILSVFIIFSMVISIDGDVSAGDDDLLPMIDVSNKTFKCYVRPYAGLKAKEAACYDGGSWATYPDSSNNNLTIFYSMSDDSSFGLFDEFGKRLSADDVLVKGKNYTYKAVFVSKTKSPSSVKAYDITDFKVKMIDYVCNKEESCKVSEPIVYSDSYVINIQYEFKASDFPSNDLGCLTINLINGNYKIRNRYQEISYCLQYLSLEDIICWEDSHNIDLNNDGIDDIAIYEDSIKKLSTISVKGNQKYELPKSTRDYLDKQCLYWGRSFYSSIEFMFDKIDISKATVSNIEDKVYTGSEITQSLVVELGNETLFEPRDYTVSYSNNIAVGTATVTITGAGNYTGTVSKTFKIKTVENVEKSDNEISEITGTIHGDISSGLWVERSDGTFPVSQWAKVNGKTYYFDKRGYAAANEYADGKWFNADGTVDETYSMEWKSNATGWWIEDKSGWYPVSRWLKIDGYWYYFLDSGYMDYSEYRDGCWLGSSGAWIETMYGGHWCSDSKGWWYEDATGWYPTNLSLWIDGVQYTFGSDGYMK